MVEGIVDNGAVEGAKERVVAADVSPVGVAPAEGKGAGAGREVVVVNGVVGGGLNVVDGGKALNGEGEIAGALAVCVAGGLKMEGPPSVVV